MRQFLNRHPFLKSQIKLIITIFVGWNAFAAAAFVPFLVFVIALVAIGSALPPDSSGAPTTQETVYGTGAKKLLSIRVGGIIMGEADTSSPFSSIDSQTYGYEVKQKLRDAAGDDSIQGVVLEVNSPGGTIYGSRAIADGVQYYRETTKKPVYTYVQGMAASGGYWAASATDRIIADHGSDIGSIGVIMGPFKYYDKPISESGGLFDGGVVTQNGIENLMITAGKSKDLGSPYRRLTTDELQTLQRQVNNDYDEFVKYVSVHRSIPEATVRGQIGAMSYDNKSAKELKLIDATGSREEAYKALAKAAKIDDEDFYVVRDQAPVGFLASLLSAVSGRPTRQAASAETNQAAAARLCHATQSRLAFAGNVTALCPGQ